MDAVAVPTQGRWTAAHFETHGEDGSFGSVVPLALGGQSVSVRCFSTSGGYVYVGGRLVKFSLTVIGV